MTNPKIQTASNGDLIVFEQRMGRYTQHIYNYFDQEKAEAKVAELGDACCTPKELHGRKASYNIDHRNEF